MEDKLEKFIRENRKEFDLYEPREQLWERIQPKITSLKKKQKKYFLIAASLTSILCLATWMVVPHTKQQAHDVVPQSIDNEIIEKEKYYTALIDSKQNEMMQYCLGHTELCNEFKSDIETLNAMYGSLKTEYKQSPDREVVLKAMIENLETQLKILNKQLQILQKIKQKEQIIKKETT